MRVGIDIDQFEKLVTKLKSVASVLDNHSLNEVTSELDLLYYETKEEFYSPEYNSWIGSSC